MAGFGKFQIRSNPRIRDTRILRLSAARPRLKLDTSVLSAKTPCLLTFETDPIQCETGSSSSRLTGSRDVGQPPTETVLPARGVVNLVRCRGTVGSSRALLRVIGFGSLRSDIVNSDAELRLNKAALRAVPHEPRRQARRIGSSARPSGASGATPRIRSAIQ